MIKLEKIDNEKITFESCNSCHKHTDKIMYHLIIRFNNAGGQQITLCKQCLKELKQIIKLR